MSELQKAFLGEDGKSDGIKEFFTGKDDFTIPIAEKDLEKLQGLTGFIGELSEADFQGMEGDIYKIVKAISDMNLNDDDFNGFDLLGKKMNKFIKIVDVKAFEKLGKALPDIATASKTIGGLNLNTINLKDQAVESDVKAGGGVVVSPTTDNSTIIQNNNSSTPVIKPASYSSPMPPAGGGMRYII